MVSLHRPCVSKQWVLTASSSFSTCFGKGILRAVSITTMPYDHSITTVHIIKLGTFLASLLEPIKHDHNFRCARCRGLMVRFNTLTRGTVFVFRQDTLYGLLTKCEVKMAGYWPSSFLACLWTETESRSINSQKKRTRPISSHLDRTSLVNKGFIIWLSGKFFLRDMAGSPKRAR